MGPVAAGSTPSTRNDLFLATEPAGLIAAFIDLSLRRSRCRCQRFVLEYMMKGETAILPGMAVKKSRDIRTSVSCKFRLVRSNCRLNFRLVDIEISVDVLHVVVFFQSFDEAHHLRGLRAR